MLICLRVGGSFFLVVTLGIKKMERGVKYSSPGLLVELLQGRGLNFFSHGEIWPKKLEGGSKNSSHGLPDHLPKGRGAIFFSW